MKLFWPCSTALLVLHKKATRETWHHPHSFFLILFSMFMYLFVISDSICGGIKLHSPCSKWLDCASDTTFWFPLDLVRIGTKEVTHPSISKGSNSLNIAAIAGQSWVPTEEQKNIYNTVFELYADKFFSSLFFLKLRCALVLVALWYCVSLTLRSAAEGVNSREITFVYPGPLWCLKQGLKLHVLCCHSNWKKYPWINKNVDINMQHCSFSNADLQL